MKKKQFLAVLIIGCLFLMTSPFLLAENHLLDEADDVLEEVLTVDYEEIENNKEETIVEMEEGLEEVALIKSDTEVEEVDEIEEVISVEEGNNLEEIVAEESDIEALTESVVFEEASEVEEIEMHDEDAYYQEAIKNVIKTYDEAYLNLKNSHLEQSVIDHMAEHNQVIEFDYAYGERSFNENSGMYIHQFDVMTIYDGTSPFDNNDYAGNDSNVSNKIIRSYDQIVYRTSFSIMPHNLLEVITKGKLYFKATLSVAPSIATFNINAMQWLMNPVLNTYDTYSELEGFIEIENRVVAPKVGVLNWVVDVFGAVNQTVIPSPTFLMGVDSQTFMSTSGESVIVSAKPSVNARIHYEGMQNQYPIFGILLESVAHDAHKNKKGLEPLDEKRCLHFKMHMEDHFEMLGIYRNEDAYNAILNQNYISKLLPNTQSGVIRHDNVLNAGQLTVSGKDITVCNFDSSFKHKVTHNATSVFNTNQLDYGEDRFPFGGYYVILNRFENIQNGKLYELQLSGLEGYAYSGEKITESNLEDNKASFTLSTKKMGGSGSAGGPAQFLNITVINESTDEKYSLITNDASRNLPPDYEVYAGELVQVSQNAMMYKSQSRSYIKTHIGFIKFDTRVFETLPKSHVYGKPSFNAFPKNQKFAYVCKKNKTGWLNEEEMYNTHIQDILNSDLYELKEDVNDCTVIGFLAESEFILPSYEFTVSGIGTYPAIKVKKEALLDEKHQLLESHNPQRVGVILAELEAIDMDGNHYTRYNVYGGMGDSLDMYRDYQHIKLGLVKAVYDQNGKKVSPTKSNASGNPGGNWENAASLVGGSFFVKNYNTYVHLNIHKDTEEQSHLNTFNLDANQKEISLALEGGAFVSKSVALKDHFTMKLKIPEGVLPAVQSDDIIKKWDIVFACEKCLHPISVQEENNEIVFSVKDYPISEKLPTITLKGTFSEQLENNTDLLFEASIVSQNIPNINQGTLGVKIIRMSGATLQKRSHHLYRMGEMAQFTLYFKNDSLVHETGERIEAIIYDVIETSEQYEFLQPTLEVFFKGLEKPSLIFYYTDQVVPFRADTMDFETLGFQKAVLPLYLKNDSIYVSDQSIAEIFKQNTIKSFGFKITDVEHGSTLKMDYQAHIKEDVSIVNNAYLNVRKDVQKWVQSNAVSHYFESKKLVEVNGHTIEKDVPLITIGDILTYQIQYYLPEKSITIVDEIPSGTTLHDSHSGIYDELTHSVIYKDDIPDKNELKCVYLSVRVVEDTFDFIENEATLYIEEQPPIKTNKIRIPLLKLQINKESDTENQTVYDGDKIGYRIKVTNKSVETVKNILVDDLLDKNVQFISCEKCQYSNQKHEVQFVIDELSSNETITFELYVQVKRTKSDVIENGATLSKGNFHLKSNIVKHFIAEKPVYQPVYPVVETDVKSFYMHNLIILIGAISVFFIIRHTD